MKKTLGDLGDYVHTMDSTDLSEDLKEAERFFDWAMSYEQKGLKIAADAMRYEGRKAFKRFINRHQPA